MTSTIKIPLQRWCHASQAMANCEKAGAWMQVAVPRAGGTVAFPCTLGTCQKPWYSGESYIIVGIYWNMLDVPMITIIVTNHSWNMGKHLQNCRNVIGFDPPPSSHSDVRAWIFYRSFPPYRCMQMCLGQNLQLSYGCLVFIHNFEDGNWILKAKMKKSGFSIKNMVEIHHE